MVSTRRQSLPATETPPTRASTSHRRASSTLEDVIASPSVHMTHADELLVREATAILGQSPSSSRPTARALRHARLTEARSLSPASVRRSRTRSLAPSEASTPSRRPSSRRSTPRGSGLVPPDRRSARLSSGSGSALAMDFQGDSGSALGQDPDEDASNSAASTSSDSDSESETDSDTSDGASEDESDAEEERLDKLLQAARLSAQQKGKAKEIPAASAPDGDEDVLQLQKDDEENAEAPIPNLKIPTLPTPYLSYRADGTAISSGSKHRTKPATLAKPTANPATFELDDRPYEKELSKRQKAAQPRKATVSEQWATLPAPKRDDLPQMKRDYQALALATSLDPKRFMKGGTKLTKVPETFAIGHIIDQPRQVKDTTLHRDIRYQPGSIVQDLVRDEGTGSYAKRKYGDLQKSRMDNGRGRGWKKRSKW